MKKMNAGALRLAVSNLPKRSGDPKLSQWFTPAWAAEDLIEQYFPDLDAGDLMLEPSCGTGAFLGAVPAHVPAVGIEIDPILADEARRNTGRRVIEGDFTTVDLDFQPTAIIGNPPFVVDAIEAFIHRAKEILPSGGRMGLLLPVYAFQNSGRLTRWAEDWSIRQDALPRDLFPNLSRPISFLLFSKDAKKSLVGFALYRETASVKEMRNDVRELLARAVGQSAWKRVVAEVLQALGGEADLAEIYGAMSARRPTANPHWREQTRKVLQKAFRRIGEGRYGLPLPEMMEAA
jgi:site-specific DNA-methyltransferase (adenine-specific)